MSAAPFMQLYVADYLADTLDLTTEQHGAYLLLLMTMWRNGGALPNDPAKLARMARVTPKRWPSVWGQICKFFTVEGDNIENARLTKEYQKAVSISRERKTSGSKGGSAKALKTRERLVASATDLLPCLLQHSQISDIREEKETPNGVSKKKATRLSPDWISPPEWIAWATDNGLTFSQAGTEAAKFRDYWVAKAGRDGAKLDWLATWRNWVRNAQARSATERPQPSYPRIRAQLPKGPIQ